MKAKGSTLSHPAAGACPAPADTDTARFWSGNFGAQWNQVAARYRDRSAARDRRHGAVARARESRRRRRRIGVWDSKTTTTLAPDHGDLNGADDGNGKTAGDAAGCRSWPPACTSRPCASQTPPYPDYVSGANGLTGAFMAMLQLYFRDRRRADRGRQGRARQRGDLHEPEALSPDSHAAEDVVDARILLGIHFRFADTAARTLGSRVAWNAFTNALRPKHPGWHDFGSQRRAAIEGLSTAIAPALPPRLLLVRLIFGRRLAGEAAHVVRDVAQRDRAFERVRERRDERVAQQIHDRLRMSASGSSNSPLSGICVAT